MDRARGRKDLFEKLKDEKRQLKGLTFGFISISYQRIKETR